MSVFWDSQSTNGSSAQPGSEAAPEAGRSLESHAMAKKQPDEPADNRGNMDGRVRLGDPDEATKEYADEQREIVKKVRKLLH
jgi:hypothetical protein